MIETILIYAMAMFTGVMTVIISYFILRKIDQILEKRRCENAVHRLHKSKRM